MNSLPKIPSTLRLLISGGDVLRAAYITNLLDQVEIYNTYGPSETTVCASYYRCNDAEALADGTYPIGRGVLDTTIKILDEHLKPVKPGADRALGRLLYPICLIMQEAERLRRFIWRHQRKGAASMRSWALQI